MPCSIRALLCLIMLAACTNELPGEPEAEPGALYAQPAAPDLSHGRRRTLVDDIVAAENQLFTSSGRLFVSGDKGVYEIVQQADGYSSRKLPTSASCQFGGLTEHAGTLYANCYDGTDSSVYAAPLGEAPELRAIHALPGVALANGLTSDDLGNLYVASSFDGTILRLQLDPADPMQVRAADKFVADSGLVTNGIKFFEGNLYWTAFTTLRSVPLRANGGHGLQRDLASALTFFDDLYVDDNSFLLDDYLNGTVVTLDSSAQYLNGTPNNTFDGPSSVQPARGRLGLSATALIVTERNANRVAVYEP